MLKDQNKRCLVFSGKEGSRFKGLYETVLVGFLYPRPEFYPNESFEKWEIEEEKQKVAAMGKDIEAALGKIKGYGKSLI